MASARAATTANPRCLIIEDVETGEIDFNSNPSFCSQRQAALSMVEIPFGLVAAFQRVPLENVSKEQKIKYLKRFAFGNMDPTRPEVSPEELVGFLRKLREHRLGFDSDVFATVLSSFSSDWKKSKLTVQGKADRAWYAGFLEENHRVYAFASFEKDAKAKSKTLPTLLRFQDPYHQKDVNFRGSWLADFAQLKGMVSSIYPNLEAKIEIANLNFYDLNQKTLQRIKKSQNNIDAMIAIKDFVSAFRDGHFGLEFSSAKTLSSPPGDTHPKVFDQNTPGEVACRDFVDSKTTPVDFPFPTDSDLGFSNLSQTADYFQIRVLDLEGKSKTKVGFIRVPSFQVEDFVEICPDEWDHFRKSLTGNCDQDCRDHFQYEVLGNRLLAEFSKAVQKLKDQKISALVLDLTDNGGGEDWVGPLMRILSDQPILCGQFGIIRHPHWINQLRKDQKNLTAKLAKEKDDSTRKKIQAKIDQNQIDLAAARISCDRSKIWEIKNYEPSCSLTVKHQVLDCSPDPVYQFTTGLYRGPLFVLANSNTASASEDIVGRYQDSKIATIVGEKTLGAGCGHTNGGIDLKLKNSGIKVSMPDCARFLRSGRNEEEGILPDQPLRMNDLNSRDFTVRLKKFLQERLN